MTSRVKVPISATVGIVVIVLSTYFVARALLAETRRWAGSYAVANTPDGENYLWQALWLPLAVGSGLGAITFGLMARRLYNARNAPELRGLALVALVSCAALWLAFSRLEAGTHRGRVPEGERLWPKPKELFSAGQWAKLEEQAPKSDLNERIIPHDDALLERWTFVGLAAADVSQLLRSGIRLEPVRPTNIQTMTITVAWRMCCRGELLASDYWLQLTFSLYDAVVIREALWQEKPFVISASGAEPQPNKRLQRTEGSAGASALGR